MKVLLGPQHTKGCACVACEAARDLEALVRFYESLSGPERAESAGLLISRKILELREGASNQ